MFGRNRHYLDATKTYPFWIFIAPFTIFLVVGIPLVTKYPVPIAILLVSLLIIFVPILLYGLYGAFITGRYVQKHDFQLWKKSKSASLKDRREAEKAINAMCMRTPYLEKHMRYANKVAFIVLTIWTLVFLGIFSFIIFSAMWN